MKHRHILFAVIAWLPLAAGAQGRASEGSVVLPAGTPLPVTIGDHIPMKVGEPIRATLLYAVYDHNRVVLPVGTVVTGSIVALTPDRTRRLHARLRADFTPFHTPVVQFTSITLPDGTEAALRTGEAVNGAPISRLVAPAPRKGGAVRQQMEMLKQASMAQMAVLTGPDKKDRLVQYAYSQLPYHPERIAKDTAWTLETTEPLTLTAFAAAAPVAAVSSQDVVADAARPAWMLQAYLTDEISSGTSKAGQPIHAVVAEPILNPDGSVAVPQGSVLSGSISQARPSRFFSRAGQLRFSFGELTMPGAEGQPVQVALTGADSNGEMTMTSEGEVKPKPKDRLIVPLLLFALASRPLDQDRNDNHAFAKNALASNSLGAIGFIVGTGAQQANLASGIGYYGTAVSIYERVFRRGKEVTFPRDTRIVLETTARRGAAMKVDAAVVAPAP